MLMSVTWMNDYLDPPANEEEQGNLLTSAGFPLEERVEHGPEVALDFEMMSNRGDCTCHVGLAREIAAISGRTLLLPETGVTESDDAVESHVEVVNEAPDACPLYTARVIRGVNVTASPAGIADRLKARGDIPRNNIVDASNFVLFELGQPTHAFDLDTLAGERIVIRMARKGETFLPLGEGAEEITLTGTELVIADAEKPVALAGVKGGAASAVTESTKNILLEAATFDPVLVRNTSRLHGISSDSSFRFERGVSPLQVDEASCRLARLILEHAGGTLCKGMIATGSKLPELLSVSMRTARCRAITGQEMDDDSMVKVLDTLGFHPEAGDGRIETTVPCFRGDIQREIDLIEEVARMQGYDDLPVNESITARLAPPEPRISARAAFNDQLVGDGFVETVTHTLVNEAAAGPFMPDGCTMLSTIDACEGGDTILRPSILPSLLRVRSHNQDRGAGALRLYELGSVFRLRDDVHEELNQACLLADLEHPEDGIRSIRGVVEGLVDRMLGPDARLDSRATGSISWYSPGAELLVGDRCIGHAGVLDRSITAAFGIDHPLVAAELCLDELLGQYPPDYQARQLPAFPPIERDISAIVPESTPWRDLESTVRALDLPWLEAIEFITAFRDKRIGEGSKSITMRLRFRDPERTLTHDEIDGPAGKAMDALKSALGAEIRS